MLLCIGEIFLMNYIVSIICAVIVALPTFILAILQIKEKHRKPDETSIKIKGKFKIKWQIYIVISLFVAGLILFLFYPRWQVIDTGYYHLGDNIFRLDQFDRPHFQSPGGTNVDRLILWDKGSGSYTSNSAYSVFPNPIIWKELHMERYKEVFGGNYYLGKIVIGYNYTFSLNDILSNARRILPHNKLKFRFNTFHLSNESNSEGLTFILNNNQFKTHVFGKTSSNDYKWGKIEPITIPIELFNTGLNTLHIFVSPKFDYHEGIKYYHFEDVEITNLQVIAE
jgi:hypothetical protein